MPSWQPATRLFAGQHEPVPRHGDPEAGEHRQHQQRQFRKADHRHGQRVRTAVNRRGRPVRTAVVGMKVGCDLAGGLHEVEHERDAQRGADVVDHHPQRMHENAPTLHETPAAFCPDIADG